MKKILALSNIVTDVIRNVSDEHIQALGFEKGRFYKASPEQSKELSKDIEAGVKIPGGSGANVAAGAALLGARTGLIGTIGNDPVGEFYLNDVNNRGIESSVTQKEGQSGVCHTFITPDGERTFVLDFGVALDYVIPENAFEDTEVFHTTGYVYDDAREASEKAIGIAKTKNTRISFDLSDVGVINRNMEELKKILANSHIIFANEEEAKAFTGKLDAREALDDISKLSDIAIVKLGAKGSLVKRGEEVIEIPVVPIETLVNTNGAGDAYAAGFLSAYLAGKSLKEAGEQGSAFAARACQSEGARVSE